MADGTTALTHSALPTIRIDGREEPNLQRDLLMMRIDEQEGGLSRMDLAFTNVASRENGSAGLAYEDERCVRLGSEIKVFGGPVGGPTELFGGRISAIGADHDAASPPRLLVHAEDAAAAARLARRIEVYEDRTVADIAGEIAGRLGLTPVIAALDGLRGTWFQFNESDLAFLRRLLARQDADVQIVGSELHVSPRGEVRRNEITLTLHTDLRRLRVLADLAQQATEVRVTGFDPLVGSAIAASSSAPNLGPGSGRQGTTLFAELFGPRVEQVAHQLALTQAEAQALADAQFAQRARGFVRVQGCAEGKPELRVGTHLKLERVSPRFDNTYYVTACCHRFDPAQGYETDFFAESAWLGNAG